MQEWILLFGLQNLFMTKSKGPRTNVSLALQRKEKSACILTKHMYICKKFLHKMWHAFGGSSFIFSFSRCICNGKTKLNHLPSMSLHGPFWEDICLTCFWTKNLHMINIFTKSNYFQHACDRQEDLHQSRKYCHNMDATVIRFFFFTENFITRVQMGIETCALEQNKRKGNMDPPFHV